MNRRTRSPYFCIGMRQPVPEVPDLAAWLVLAAFAAIFIPYL